MTPMRAKSARSFIIGQPIRNRRLFYSLLFSLLAGKASAPTKGASPQMRTERAKERGQERVGCRRDQFAGQKNNLLRLRHCLILNTVWSGIFARYGVSSSLLGDYF